MGNVAEVKRKLKLGADPNVFVSSKATALDVLMSPDPKGSSPLDRMSAEQQTAIRALLEKAGGKRSLREAPTEE